jgi:hypothetical protein
MPGLEFGSRQSNRKWDSQLIHRLKHWKRGASHDLFVTITGGFRSAEATRQKAAILSQSITVL